MRTSSEFKKTSPTVSVEEVEFAEKELRDRAKSLYRNIESTYWELGGILYAVFDGVPGGYRDLKKGDGSREIRRELFRKWGYTSFEEYCELEIGIRRRTASSLRYAYWYFEVELKLPSELKEQLKQLGRSKIYVLAGFVTDENIMSWMDKATAMSVDQLKKAVMASKALAKGETEPDGDTFEHAKELLAQQENANAEHMAPPKPEEAHVFTTNLYDGQWDTCKNAIDRAKNITKSDKISHNLEMICQDYLATNNFINPKDDFNMYFSKLEVQTGLKIIAIDPASGDPVHGAELLWAMVNHADKTINKSDKPELKIIKNDDEPAAAF